MKFVDHITSYPELFKEVIGFLLRRKKWWLAPILIVLLIFSLMFILVETAPIVSFIYPLF